MSVADTLRKQARLVILLPESGLSIEARLYRVRDMLETGLGAMIRQFKEDAPDAEQRAEQIFESMKRVLVACVISPQIVFEETTHPDAVCIEDIPRIDIEFAFSQIVTVDDSRFYGVDRTKFDPDKFSTLIDAQMKICYEIDAICQRYSLSPLDVERWTDAELARVLAQAEGAEGYRKAHPPKDK